MDSAACVSHCDLRAVIQARCFSGWCGSGHAKVRGRINDFAEALGAQEYCSHRLHLPFVTATHSSWARPLAGTPAGGFSRVSRRAPAWLEGIRAFGLELVCDQP